MEALLEKAQVVAFDNPDKVSRQAMYEELDAFVASLPAPLAKEHSELLARTCRAAFQWGDELKQAGKDADGAVSRKSLVEKNLPRAVHATELDAQNPNAWKWFGILTSACNDYKGTKEKIEKSFVIKEAFEKGIALNPSDPTLHHLMGQWCFAVANLGWIERNAASLFFATPPTSTFDEALAHFRKAEEVGGAGYYVRNTLFLGKTLHQLGKKSDAKPYFQAVMARTDNAPETEDAKKEASKY